MWRSSLPMRAAIPALALLASLTVGTGAQAQEGFCALLTEAEVGEAFGDAVIAQPSDGRCDWMSTDDEGFYVFAGAGWDVLDMAERQAATPDGRTLIVGGHSALYDETYATLYIELDQGVLAINGQAEQGDHLVPLQRLGEIAVGRAAALPAPATPEPRPSFESDQELAALFPQTIGGEPLQVQTATGESIFLQSDDTEALDQMEALLVEHGLSPSDLSVGIGYPEDMSASVTALRFPGADASAFVDGVISTLGGGEASQRSEAQVAGKTVILLTTGDLAQYLYPKDDVLWAVSAQEPALTEIFEALP